VQDEQFWAERFEQQRPRLQALAYRMLGSLTEAEDAVQEAWLRVSRASGEDVDNVAGWLTTIISRQCLNMLRSRAARREDPLDVRVPDPVVEFGDGLDPAEQSVVADSVGPALLVVLESLDPAERLAFVLHDMFAVPFDEIAPMLERTPAAARQLASRARRRVQGATPAGKPDRVRQREIVDAWLAAHAAATWQGWSRCCTRTPCCASTPVTRAPRSSAVQLPSPGRRRGTGHPDCRRATPLSMAARAS
jgi:RNA polymerase sigma-70 factor (ECF subfamily)